MYMLPRAFWVLLVMVAIFGRSVRVLGTFDTRFRDALNVRVNTWPIHK